MVCHPQPSDLALSMMFESTTMLSLRSMSALDRMRSSAASKCRMSLANTCRIASEVPVTVAALTT